MKVIPCVLIAAGAVASSATSKIQDGWVTSKQMDFTPSVIDSHTTSVSGLVLTLVQDSQTKEITPPPGTFLDVTVTPE